MCRPMVRAAARTCCRSAEPSSPGGVPTAISCSSDRKSTRLNSSHSQISYAVFCLKKKKTTRQSADNDNDREARGALRSRRLHAEDDLGYQQLRPVRRRARDVAMDAMHLVVRECV